MQQQQQPTHAASPPPAQAVPAPAPATQQPSLHTHKQIERQVKSVAYPIVEPLATDVLFVNGRVDLTALQKHLVQEGKLQMNDIFTVIKQATAIFLAEPTLLVVDPPVTVCGDIHGQFYDLLRLFEIGGAVARTTYLFLGDYVDRGSFSCEVLFLMYSLKITYPKTFFMIRGNHECRHLTEFFTFKQECLRKYNEKVYEAFLESFHALPLGALVNNQFLCIHGGISPEIRMLEDIRRIDRFREPPQLGAMCDVLWADPAENFNPSNDDNFGSNEVRGCSYVFTYRAACAFLERNKLLSIIRAHEAQDEGYKMYLHRESTSFPTVITIFSAPNYLDAYNNKGAVLRYERNVLNIRQFTQVPHPYWLPNFMDVFTWSLPFVAEKVAEMLMVLVQLCDDEDGGEAIDASLDAAESDKKRQEVQQKVLAASRFLMMYKTLREERENILQLKGCFPGQMLPRGLLLEGPCAIQQALATSQKTPVAPAAEVSDKRKRPSMARLKRDKSPAL
eukprot:TRINITY_DN1116_c0_g2_i1.p1 TRINITY_DN1116_c0_g2~~TRINITY_DN1116_c0_g2_i1.p1  ORF type:complete len:569 (-),score=175.55 TRINITY_DN1116_c0_g2_i1:42-1556(-)